VVRSILRRYTELRLEGERFIDAVERLGIVPFKAHVYAQSQTQKAEATA
jgi:sulfite reductase (NADPH) hemoprotein beta-component